MNAKLWHIKRAPRKASARCETVLIIRQGQTRDEKSGRIYPSSPSSDTNGETVRNWRTHAFLQPASFFSLSAFRNLGGLDESLDFAMDFDLWIRLGEIGEFKLIDNLIAEDLRHEGAKTYHGMGDYYAEAFEALLRRGHGADGRRMIRALYDEYAYLSRLVRPFAENRLYKKLLRPWLRRRFAPDHLK